jgi:hypothetical protein
MKTKYLEKFKSVHGNKYDYSLVEFIDTNEKIIIICPEHGEFKQSIYSHTSGQGCPKCKGKGKRKTTNFFIEQAISIHSDKYDYSLVDYVDGKTDIIIICPIHGKTIQKPNQHLQTKGCRKCGDKLSGISSNIHEFIDKSNMVHGNKFKYSNSIYIGNNDKLIITCPIHGDFKQTPHNHLKGHGCPHCRESKGEKEIKKLLLINNISFTQQHKFPDCRNILPLPFDFYLPDYHLCIEFNGRQHYKSISVFGGDEEFQKVKIRDKIKIEYCEMNNIPLVIFKYDENIFDKFTQFLVDLHTHN